MCIMMHGSESVKLGFPYLFIHMEQLGSQWMDFH